MARTDSFAPAAVRRAPVGAAPHGGVERSVIWLRGDLDISTVAGVSDTFSRAIAIDDADLVVDLSGVTFMGAETIGVIARARRFLCRRSRSVELRAPSARASRILDLCDVALSAGQVGTRTLPARRVTGHVSDDARRRAP